MRVIYYCLPGLLEHIPPEVKALSNKVKLNVVFEVTPKTWKNNLLDLPQNLPLGFWEGREFLKDNLPPDAWDFFSDAEGIYFSVYPAKTSIKTFKTIKLTVNGIKKINPNILHFDGESIRAFICTLAMRYPIVDNIHEPDVSKFENLLLFKLTKILFYRKANGIIVHSKEAFSKLARNKNIKTNKIEIAPLGEMSISKTFLKLTPQFEFDANHIVLYVGWLSYRKGADIFIEAARLAANNINNTCFILAGKPSYGFPLPEDVGLPNNNSIKIIPRFINNSELAELLTKANLIVLPYRESTQSSVILTAYAYGKPVICPDLDAFSEQMWDMNTGMFFSHNDPSDLAIKIIKLICEPQLIVEMEKNIIEKVNHQLNWDHFGQASVRLYNQLDNK